MQRFLTAAAIAATLTAAPAHVLAGTGVRVPGEFRSYAAWLESRANTPTLARAIRPATAPHGDGFHWDDAAVGASVSGGALLLAGWSLLRPRRRAQLAQS